MYLSLSIQPLSLSAFYSKANLAQAAHFFSRVLFPIELKWLNRIPLPALFGQFLTFIPQIRHKSTAQKDRGSHNTKVLQTFECCKPSREFYFDGLFQQRYRYQQLGVSPRMKSCGASTETAQVCLLKCHCKHANHFILLLNNTLHAERKYLQSSY